MVVAALKFVSDEETPVTYANQDVALLGILATLNRYEAHGEYEWPDFTSMGFDFCQTMRFRRQLVSDVLNALQKADTIKIASGVDVLGTLDSGGASRGRKRFAGEFSAT